MNIYTPKIFIALLAFFSVCNISNAQVGPISGTGTICQGLSSTLSDATPGGTWSSSNVAVATVSSSGIVGGVSAGTAIISYSATTGVAVTTVTVLAAPSSISGPTVTCLGTTTTLTDAVPGGVWTSSNTAIATIGPSTGTVYGITFGTTIISYTLGSGCYATTVMTVSAAPCPFSSTSLVCVGSSVTLTDCVSGGTWSSSSTTVATINPLTGVVTGISAGITSISYSIGTGCMAVSTVTVTLGAGPIIGVTALCSGGFSTTLTDLTPGGTWSSSDITIASVGATTGAVSSGLSGTCIITYSLSTGCSSTTTVTVYPPPSPIAGPSSVCLGSCITLSSSTPGGTWSAGSPAIATIGGSGTVCGLVLGTTTIMYTLPTGCFSTTTISVTPLPGTISGTTTMCVGSYVTLTDATGGGTWSSSNPSVAVAGSTTGIIAGASAGTATITYSLSSGCTATASVTVMATPSGISGITTACAGTTMTLTVTPPGGVWSTGTPSIATVSPAGGVVWGVAGGTAVITYMLADGCYTTTFVTISPAPAPISGTTAICIGSTATLSDATGGGTWSSSNTSVATISSGGLTGGVASGTSVISYTVGSGCPATTTVTVNPLPPACTVTGGGSFCPGSSGVLIGLSCSYVGINYQLYTGGAPVGSPLSGTGLSLSFGYVTTAGTYTILATNSSTGCYVWMTGSATVSTLSSPGSVSGTTAACIGSTAALSDATTGGTWSSSATSIASIDAATGVVSGIAAGAAIISYTLSTGCYATTSFTVLSLPAITATATAASCGGSYTLTAGGATSYSWAPTTGLSCSVCSTASVTPTATTIYTVTGTDVFGCSDTASVLVDGNRISGYITIGGSSTSLLVWLIQFNPSDSSIAALDSTTACLVGGVPYYEFLDKAAGNYLVKVKLTTSVPGTSGYIPTYSFSTPNWYLATTAAHTSSLDTLNINMLYGTVPPGPGFISGYVYAGAGRGTSGDAPAPGIMILLQDAGTGNVLTYTYTDGTGAYSFSGLADGSYVIYPEAYDFNTTPSAVITLASPSDSATGNNFKQYLTSKAIKPLPANGIKPLPAQKEISAFPNPAANNLVIEWKNQETGKAAVEINDLLGRNVDATELTMDKPSGHSVIDLSSLSNGVYILSIKSSSVIYSSKLVIEK